jgi:gas vesicle protein
MLEQIKGTNGKILMAVLTGATAGIIAGLLMAPKTGSGLRKSLTQSALQAKDRIANSVKEYIRNQQSGEQNNTTGTSPG